MVLYAVNKLELS